MAHVITPITRLLIANRGEIARRINRTAQAMGISTVAIYADGDANAPFVQEADTAIALDGKTTGQTYLDVAKVLGAAQRSNADAIHPGYGFLSENQAFAQAVIDAGVKWLGPSPEVIGLMGDKLSTKRLMEYDRDEVNPAYDGQYIHHTCQQGITCWRSHDGIVGPSHSIRNRVHHACRRGRPHTAKPQK